MYFDTICSQLHSSGNTCLLWWWWWSRHIPSQDPSCSVLWNSQWNHPWFYCWSASENKHTKDNNGHHGASRLDLHTHPPVNPPVHQSVAFTFIIGSRSSTLFTFSRAWRTSKSPLGLYALKMQKHNAVVEQNQRKLTLIGLIYPWYTSILSLMKSRMLSK